ncbi:hypothetical protein [Thermomonas sp.]|uniref:hypothetical protein n=1 Tax=Thermomonas sp. TaxID=1971895 RepID=UPI002487145D|nr:hypothetical protein [Thermomonas sp.]MDI1254088.1 hypothetical protein [Thermomonas sp.]
MSLSRYFAPAVLAASLGLAAVAAPAPVQAQSSNDLMRVLVNVADVVMQGNQPYYRYGDYGYNDRLVVLRDRYGRVAYYRDVPRTQYRPDASYRNEYYDPRHDRDGRYGNSAHSYRHDDRRKHDRDNDDDDGDDGD